jgi:hypothetical protein
MGGLNGKHRFTVLLCHIVAVRYQDNVLLVHIHRNAFAFVLPIYDCFTIQAFGRYVTISRATVK